MPRIFSHNAEVRLVGLKKAGKCVKYRKSRRKSHFIAFLCKKIKFCDIIYKNMNREGVK